ncbi:EXLDI protein [Nocardia sp. NPDC050712]|uniref:EXLDI protein n=1 Tax=Nocardia sp. NPDC050712 TaxID=3155518 RepID=UPI0033CAF738
MPNKTIYVSDDDLPLFQRAQELVGGNLSGAVTTALRRFIELEEGREEGYEEVVLKVGHNGVRQVRFSGALIGELQDDDEHRMARYRVYRSRKGKYVMHALLADWTDYPTGQSGNWIKDLTNWRRMLGVGDPDWGDFVLVIVDSIEELKDHLPDKLYTRVADIAERPPIEELDI